MHSSFDDWVEQQVRSAPNDILAFSFNLFEEKGGFSVEIIGATEFWADNSDWACREDYVPVPRQRWQIPSSISGPNWESCLRAMTQEIDRLMERRGIRRLISVKAVALGFVDGDLQILKS
jgi:hypothetical protein